MTDHNDAPTRKKSVWPLVIGLPLIAVIAAAAIFFSSTGEEGAEPPSEESPAPSEESLEEASGDASDLGHPAIGDEDAPVVMVEFSDYQ